MGRPRLDLPCPDCGTVRSAETAYRVGQFADGTARYSVRCKRCHVSRTRQYEKSSPERTRAYKAERRRAAGVVPLAERPKRTHCRLGHPYDSVKNGYLRCLTCHRAGAERKRRAEGVPPVRRTHCPQGHELTPDNIRGGSKGRACALCHRLRQRRVFDADAKRYAAIIVRDPCVYCGGPGGTVDHIKALANGGGDDWHNLAGACHSCNARKRTIELLPFLLRRTAKTGVHA